MNYLKWMKALYFYYPFCSKQGKKSIFFVVVAALFKSRMKSVYFFHSSGATHEFSLDFSQAAHEKWALEKR